MQRDHIQRHPIQQHPIQQHPIQQHPIQQHPIQRHQATLWAKRLVIPVILLALVALAAPVLGGRVLGAHGASTPEVLSPVGGGYDEAPLEGFAQTVIQHASGSAVNILVVPAAYGNEPQQHQYNVKLATQRTNQIQAACNAVVNLSVFPNGCQATLVMLFTNADGSNPTNVAAFNNLQSGGCFILGGDQDIAMEVMAGTPVETAMAGAYARGVVFGGTSSGAAVLSANMNAGDSATGGPTTGLQEGSIVMWWADDTNLQRGLSFGSQQMIYDQHVDQRGRFGRILTAVALSADHYHTSGLLGVGSDYDTGAAVTNDATISGVYGDTVLDLVDFQTDHATYQWEGTSQWLSARHVLTHLLAPVAGLSYDASKRVPVLNSKPVAFVAPPAWSSSLLRAPGAGTLILGGDVSGDATGPAIASFVSRAQATGQGKIVVVAAGYSSVQAAQQDASNYQQELHAAGWGSSQTTPTIIYGSSSLDPHQLDGAAGVLFVGGDQSQLPTPVSDPSFQSLVSYALQHAPVVMSDHAMTAAMGDWYDAIPEPPSTGIQDAAIADFQASNANVQPGLGIVHGAAFEPRFTEDQRWGRIYGLSMAHPSTIVFGVTETTALVLGPNGAQVSGKRPVVSVDGRAATFMAGTNGAIGALNVVMDTFAPGDTVANG